MQIYHWQNIFTNILAPKEYTVPMQEVICDNLIGLCVCVWQPSGYAWLWLS